MSIEKFMDTLAVLVLVLTLFTNAFTGVGSVDSAIGYFFEAFKLILGLWLTTVVAIGSWHYLKLKHGDN
jgi:hypothetical protein